ncbi:hypothetical protein [Haloarchaeobius amylolyticus]|uniref:hypothetical protein n=1 Tax=Haloarchaeobius amylolyticus TaxID=1198296 RepID=UPI00226D442D|nr:hypothetical protein [Haloarchaeobius amylolyticus]
MTDETDESDAAETFSGAEVADLIGPKLAAALGIRGQEFTKGQVDALTKTLAESTAIAEAVGEGDTSQLTRLFSPAFLAAHTEFDDFEAFQAASPWDENIGAAFAARDAGEPDGPATTTSSFLSRTTEFTTPGAMVQAAVIDRTKREVDAL